VCACLSILCRGQCERSIHQRFINPCSIACLTSTIVVRSPVQALRNLGDADAAVPVLAGVTFNASVLLSFQHVSY
jgi:hypothetical protein